MAHLQLNEAQIQLLQKAIDHIDRLLAKWQPSSSTPPPPPATSASHEDPLAITPPQPQHPLAITDSSPTPPTDSSQQHTPSTPNPPSAVVSSSQTSPSDTIPPIPSTLAIHQETRQPEIYTEPLRPSVTSASDVPNLIEAVAFENEPEDIDLKPILKAKSPIYLDYIIFTKEPYESLRGLLDLRYCWMIFTLTNSVNKCFERNAELIDTGWNPGTLALANFTGTENMYSSFRILKKFCGMFNSNLGRFWTRFQSDFNDERIRTQANAVGNHILVFTYFNDLKRVSNAVEDDVDSNPFQLGFQDHGHPINLGLPCDVFLRNNVTSAALCDDFEVGMKASSGLINYGLWPKGFNFGSVMQLCDTLDGGATFGIHCCFQSHWIGICQDENGSCEYHPDVKKQLGATEKFKKISAAYVVLSDVTKKCALYAQYGEDGVKSTVRESVVCMADPFVFFTIFFGPSMDGFSGVADQTDSGTHRSTITKGEDIRSVIELEFTEAVFGREKEFELSHLQMCEVCIGNGAKPGLKIRICSTYGGRGQVRQKEQTPFGLLSHFCVCPNYDRNGEVILEFCCKCCGESRIQVMKEIKLIVLNGANKGSILSVIGEGDVGPKGGSPGDLYVDLGVEEIPEIQRASSFSSCAHLLIFKTEFYLHSIAASTLVHACAKRGKIVNAESIFIMSFLSKKMEAVGMQPNDITVIALPMDKKWATTFGLMKIDEGGKIIEMYFGSNGEIAERCFGSLKNTFRTDVVYRSMLRNYVQHKYVEKADAIMQKMRELGMANSTLPYNYMIHLYSQTGRLAMIDHLVLEMGTKGISVYIITRTQQLCDIVPDGYIKAENIGNALDMRKDFKWTILLKGNRFAAENLCIHCAENGSRDGVYRVWNQSKLSFRKLTSFVTYMTSCFPKLDDIDGAEEMFNAWQSYCHIYNIRVANELLSAYCSMGPVDKANSVIQEKIKHLLKSKKIMAQELPKCVEGRISFPREVEYVKINNQLFILEDKDAVKEGVLLQDLRLNEVMLLSCWLLALQATASHFLSCFTISRVVFKLGVK